jgi:hypothetical protein
MGVQCREQGPQAQILKSLEAWMGRWATTNADERWMGGQHSRTSGWQVAVMDVHEGDGRITGHWDAVRSW